MPKIAVLMCAIFAFVVPVGFVLLTGTEISDDSTSQPTKKKSAGKLMYFYQTS